MIYSANIMGYTMGYICQKLWDILDKTKGYIGYNFGIYYGIYWLKIVGCIWKNYGIYWSKTINNFMGCIRQKLWDILG